MNNILNIQQQTKENAEDLQKYLLELDSWEKEMKKKEEELKLIQMTTDEVFYVHSLKNRNQSAQILQCLSICRF